MNGLAQELLLGIDIGTTNSKAGLFDTSGRQIAVASRPTRSYQSAKGNHYYDPEEMWETIASAIREVTAQADGRKVAAIGIASMAESGLLVDRQSGKPRSTFMPWFDTCSTPQAERISRESDSFERFTASGLHNSFKLGLAKLLWLKENEPEAFNGSVWLSASGYIAYRLCGTMAFDYSLAARTYAFRVDRKAWDAEWLQHFGLDVSIFPEPLPSGTVLGMVSEDTAASLGLSSDSAVSIAGHDHVAASLSVGSIVPGVVYDSMGTAETLVGTLEEKPLGREEFAAGLSFGCHVAKDRYFWMGGNAASGGSVEWLRGQLGEEPISYELLLSLLADCKPGPTGILYFPYLSGSSAPMPEPKARGAFIGLTKSHGRGELIKAVLEGTGYQLEWIRESAQQITGRSIERLLVVGGGTRNPHWLQVKADITGCTLDIPPISEATLLGAALAAGVGSGVYGTAEEAAASVSRENGYTITADAGRNSEYRKLYEAGYVPLQAPLRQYYKSI
jgi:sugar (pentulose or hexulose) kinase